MSADPILYCLERLTDYHQFERLASDLMAGTDYPGIEPLGGTADGGRDALYIDRSKDHTTVFAYSVRSDWSAKLQEDCRRIAETKSQADTIVFVSTHVISTRRKEQTAEDIKKRYGWSVVYYDVERIRVLLTGPLRSLVGHHPAIFVSPWFDRRGGELVTHEQHDLVLIDHLPVDRAFAGWLFSRLSAAGYSVWCHSLAPLAGEDADASIRTLIQQRAVRYLPVLSQKSVYDPDFRSRIAIATADANRTVPCWLNDLSSCDFDSQLAAIVPARFDVSWKTGLESISRYLHGRGFGKPLEGDRGRVIALNAYRTENLLSPKPERVFANVFPVECPEALLVYELDRENVDLSPLIERQWAYVRRGTFIFSFSNPPDTLRLSHEMPLQYAWRHYSHRFGVRSEDLVKHLVKRSLFVACYQAGFQWCSDRHAFFLDEEPRQRHAYQHVDGTYTHVSFTGERTWRSGDHPSKFVFQIGPVFRVSFDDEGSIWLTVRFYLRLTDRHGALLDKKMIPSRRKRVTRTWWNRQWLQRTLGLMQFIAGKGPDIHSHIIIGNGRQAVDVAVAPLTWECPVSIDVKALDRVGDYQAELAAAQEVSDDTGFYQEET